MISLKEINGIKYKYFLQFIIPIFYLLIFFKNYIGEQNKEVQLVFTGLYIFIGVILTIILVPRVQRNSLIAIVIYSLIILSLITSIFSENYRIEDNILIFTYFGIALIPFFVTLNYTIYKVFAYSIILFFLVQIINGVNSNNIFDVSRNFISVSLLWGVGFHIISCFQNNRIPSILIIILSLAVSIWATGRGGIIAFSLLLVFMPFLIKTNKFYKFMVIGFIIGLSIYTFYNLYDLLFEFGLGRFEDMQFESERSTINNDYLNCIFISISNLMVGANIMDIPSIIEVDGNPHNSFIRLHVYYGLFGFVLLFSLLTFTTIKLFFKKNYLYLLLLIVLLVRSAVDSIAFHGPFDPLIYFLIFHAIANVEIINKPNSI